MTHAGGCQGKSASHAFGSGDTSGSSGARRGSPSGSKINVISLHFSLDLLNAKHDNLGVGGKKNPNAQALGSLGGKARAKSLSLAERAKIASAGGKARAAKLTAAERKRIAKAAVAARERKREGKADA
jgi:hypothetical protein